MKTLLAIALASSQLLGAQKKSPADIARWEATAKRVNIVRDDWGIAHVYGKTDADVVFGALYAQSEDDFNRVETNFINSQGRLAEAEGESAIYRDLRMKIFVNPDSTRAKYRTSPVWLRKLMDSWADGLNFYLYKHPAVTPRVITHFEPWMALTFSEGSIGGDIEAVNLRELEAFYGKHVEETATPEQRGEEAGFMKEPSGSNGFAIAPSNTANHRAILWINPHTSFFFRSELQMVSEEGLNAYGASTWGQFFIYQGFNNRAGWMHTTSNADDADEYAETVQVKRSGYSYKYGMNDRPVVSERIAIPYKTASGMAQKVFTVYRTHHGPVVRLQNGRWIAVRMMHDPVNALSQSYLRTKARNYAEFRKTMDLHTNSSNNTIYADADGTIAYFHGNFIPVRDQKFDWTKPVDGSDPATEWKGMHTVEQSPHLKNPASGWLYNTNNWPYSAAGESSPVQAKYPAYMEDGFENPRGIHAVRVLSSRKDFTPASVMGAAFDSWLPSFELLVPSLLSAYDNTQATDPMRVKLASQIEVLRAWDRRWAANSIATSLAVFWGEELQRRTGARGAWASTDSMMALNSSPAIRLEALATASAKLESDFGSWKTPWGEINRFQRITDDIVHPFTDAGPSIPVPFTSSRWGSLASFGARPTRTTKKWYGTSGNSFLAVVEFGDSVRARAVSAGGESGDPSSRHFTDQAERYASGNLRDVYFYRTQLKGHTEREYHPGQ